jgi:hypothetical protein
VQLDGSDDFVSFYSSHVSGLMRFRNGSGKGRASNFVQLSEKMQWCVGKRRRAEECSVAPLYNKRVKNLCGWQ